jgi:hypothetical protein
MKYFVAATLFLFPSLAQAEYFDTGYGTSARITRPDTVIFVLGCRPHISI